MQVINEEEEEYSIFQKTWTNDVVFSQAIFSSTTIYLD